MPEIPKEPQTIEGYAAFMVEQGKEKKWSNDTTWLMLSMFKEVGELVAEYEKIKSTEHITPEQASKMIAEILGLPNMNSVQVAYDFKDDYLVIIDFDDEVAIEGAQYRKIEKKTGFTIHRTWWGTDERTDKDSFQVIFSKSKNPYLKLGAESSDIDYFKWQFMKTVAPMINLDQAMLDKMHDNQVNQKKTIDGKGNIVRK